MDALTVAQEGKNRWMFLLLVLLRQFTFSLPPRPLNYTNGVLVSAVRRLMATTLFRGTNESVWTAAWAICWWRPTSTDATTAAAKDMEPWYPATLISLSVLGATSFCTHTPTSACCCCCCRRKCLSCSSRWSKLDPICASHVLPLHSSHS